MSIEIRRKQGLKMAQRVRIDATELTADAAVADGGDGAGPSPHDLYDAALGACKALTVMWYANRKKIPVDDVQVDVERDASQERTGTYALTTRIRIGGPVTDLQIEELRSAAEKCPIQKLMTAVTTTIATQVVRIT